MYCDRPESKRFYDIGTLVLYMAKNPKRVALTMPEDLQARLRKYMGNHNRKPHEWSLIICDWVGEKLAEEGY